MARPSNQSSFSYGGSPQAESADLAAGLFTGHFSFASASAAQASSRSSPSFVTTGSPTISAPSDMRAADEKKARAQYKALQKRVRGMASRLTSAKGLLDKTRREVKFLEARVKQLENKG